MKSMSSYIKLSTNDNETNITPSTSEMTTSRSTDEFNVFQSSDMNVNFNKSKLEYSYNELLWAHFSSLFSLYEMKNDDQIGICRLLNDKFILSKAISQCEVDEEMEQLNDLELDEEKIVAKKTSFAASDLPKIDDPKSVYFQFCYKNAENQILGKSVPFKINFSKEQMVASQSPMLNESINQLKITEQQEEDDFIVVRSQESFLKERNENLTKSNTLLQYLIRNMESDLLGKNNEIKELKSQLENIMNDLNNCKKDEEKLKLIASDRAKEIEMIKEAYQLEKELRIRYENELNSLKTYCQDYDNNRKDVENLQIILEDKEKEISICQKFIEEYKKATILSSENAIKLECELEESKSKLAEILNDRRNLLEEKNNLHSSNKTLDESLAILSGRIEELESSDEKKSKKIIELEKELNECEKIIKELDLKSENAKLIHMRNIQELTLANDKLNVDYLEIRARLEHAKVEYGNLYAKYQNLKKKFERKSTDDSISLSDTNIIKVSNDSVQSSIISLDPIDQALQDLEADLENEQVQASAPSKATLSIMSEDPIIKDTSKSQPIVNTAVKTLFDDDTAGPSDVQYPNLKNIESSNKEKKNVVYLPCIICESIIECKEPKDQKGQLDEMIHHFEKVHKQKVCPVCSVMFDTNLPMFKTYFSNHIENHFKQMHYPRKFPV